MKVSIIIPFYNASDFLEATIRSAIDQSYPDKEIILVDDGSTDGSLSIARSFKSGDVKIISQINSGACVARNRALAEAQGDFIQYLDADDLLSPDKIKHQMRLFEKYGNDIVASSRWVRFYDEQELNGLAIPSRFLDRDWENPIDWLINSWDGKGMGQTSIWLTPRHIIEKAGLWDERLLINQDGEFFCRVLLKASAIKHAKEAIVYYRSGMADSISRKLNIEKGRSQLFSYKLCEERLLSRENSLRARHSSMMNYMSFIYHNYDNYPELIQEAKQRIRDLGFTKLSIFGGRRFGMLARLIGFENALKMRSWARKTRFSS